MSFLKVDGLVIKETKYGESNKALTVITAQLGKITVFAHRVKASRLFCYSSMELKKSKDGYTLKESSLINSFPNLRDDLLNFAYAVYFADIINSHMDENIIETGQLSLLLNTIYMLGQKNSDILKVVYEIKCMCNCGFEPNMTNCAACGSADNLKYFDILNGIIYCGECEKPNSAIPLPKVVLDIMNYIKLAPLKQVFSIEISADCLEFLAQITEKYVLIHSDKEFKSLAYLKSIKKLG